MRDHTTGKTTGTLTSGAPPAPAGAPSTPPAIKRGGTDNGVADGRAKDSGRLLAIVLAGQFMAVLDAFVVNVAAPSIGGDLRASGAALQLVIGGYTVAYAVLLITGARIGELLGPRRTFLAGLAVFTGASLACGLAADTGQLIGFRAVQGAGAAVMIPQVLGIVQRTFTGAARTRAIGAYTAVMAVGAVTGQVAGGVLVGADLFGAGWRPVFLVNVPIGVLLLVAGPRLIPGDRPSAAARGLDLPGLVLLAGALTLLTVPLVLGREAGWPQWSWWSLGAGGLLLAAFAAYEAARARRGGAPLIAPRVIGAPGMPRKVVRIAVVMAVNAGYMFVLTLHFQNALHYSPLRTGLTFVPTALAYGAVGLWWRLLPRWLHPVLVPGGFVLLCAALLGAGLALRGGGDGGAWAFLAYAGVGVGLGFAHSPNLAAALASVRREHAADASGLVVTVNQVGLLLGTSLFGALYLNRLAAEGADGAARALWVSVLALAGAAAFGWVAGVAGRRS
ncbi:MFS transporter [Streptomyces sp. CT34]|uniref:MFS transporter n=1 Tax=Streptomyces sp. CT34 TaxID=1553907 RepID=UPI00099BBB99|nr:MFS transporter [Streptomyces sp. CT34]